MAAQNKNAITAHISPFLRWVHDFRTPPEYWQHDRIINDHALFYIKEGLGEISVDGETYLVTPGDAILVRPNLVHTVRAQSQPFHMFNIHFDLVESPGCENWPFVQDPSNRRMLPHDETVSANPEDWGCLPVYMRVNPVTYERLFNRILSLYSFNDPVSKIEIKAAMLDLLAFLFRLKHQSSAASRSSSQREAAQAAAKFILSDYPRPLSIDTIADQIGTSRATLIRSFRIEFATTPMAYLRGVRVTNAKQALLLTSQPLKEIAAQTGFAGIHHFTRVFSQETGMPPAAFRAHFAGTIERHDTGTDR